MPDLWDNIRFILEHLVLMLVIELALGLTGWGARIVFEEGALRTVFVGVDSFAMLGAALWFIRNLAAHLWNNRVRFGGPNVFVMA